ERFCAVTLRCLFVRNSEGDNGPQATNDNFDGAYRCALFAHFPDLAGVSKAIEPAGPVGGPGAVQFRIPGEVSQTQRHAWRQGLVQRPGWLRGELDGFRSTSELVDRVWRSVASRQPSRNSGKPR